jgi:hypothetical protein
MDRSRRGASQAVVGDRKRQGHLITVADFPAMPSAGLHAFRRDRGVVEYGAFTARLRELGWIAHRGYVNVWHVQKKAANGDGRFYSDDLWSQSAAKIRRPERSVTIAHEDLLFECIALPEVKRLAGELFQGPIPYSTHDLAVSTALAFFKAPEFIPVLTECQIPARLRVVNWAKDGKVVGPLAQSFEAVLYRVYKPGQAPPSSSLK